MCLPYVCNIKLNGKGFALGTLHNSIQTFEVPVSKRRATVISAKPQAQRDEGSRDLVFNPISFRLCQIFVSPPYSTFSSRLPSPSKSHLRCHTRLETQDSDSHKVKYLAKMSLNRSKRQEADQRAEPPCN